jgi:Fe-S cluster assembly protein SufD
MNAVVTKTEAEDQLARQFEQVAAALPGGDWMPDIRAKAMRAFAKAGLPHRRIEEWKYTDVRAGLETAYAPATCSHRKVDQAMLAEALGQQLAALPCIRLVLVNGRIVSRSIPEGHEPGAGWSISALSGAIGQPGFEWLEGRFNASRPLTGTRAVVDLNTAFVTDGTLLSFAEGHEMALPVHIVSIVDGDVPASVAIRNFIDLAAGSRATIVETHIGLGTSANVRQCTAVTQIRVGEGAEAQHLQSIAGGADALHLGQWDVELAGAAIYRGFQLTAGMGLARNETHVCFTGPNAKLDLSGLMLGRGADHIDTTLVVDHTTTGCEGRELFKAVLDDRARAVFQGKVIVAPEAQKTDGKQMAQALMLSETCEFDSKPELEIYADDVVCGHGSTVAELDRDMMFYLRTRGIEAGEARALLIESFASEALDKVEDVAIREAFRTMALDWLETRA